MTALLKPHPDGEGCTCAHCDAEESSLWRPARDGTGYVCRCNDCWRDEGWLPPKKKRGRKSKSDPGAEIDLVMLAEGVISSITKIEAQRCAPHDLAQTRILFVATANFISHISFSARQISVKFQ